MAKTLEEAMKNTLDKQIQTLKTEHELSIYEVEKLRRIFRTLNGYSNKNQLVQLDICVDILKNWI